MRIRVDQDKCQGHALCAAHAPHMFQLDELGFNRLDREVDVPPDEQEAVTNAVRGCPERAIELVDQSTANGGLR